MPAAGVFSQGLKPRPQKGVDTNTLVAAFPGIRRLDIVLFPSVDTRNETSDVWWVLSAWATVTDPADYLPGLAPSTPTPPGGTPAPQFINLSPSLLIIPPLGAGGMHIATAFWPELPPASAISVLFSTPADQPQGNALVFGYASATPHNDAGLFRAPYGHAQLPARLVSPLPTDPRILEYLELEDRIMTPRLPPEGPYRRKPR
jgi:hypothetical protein